MIATSGKLLKWFLIGVILLMLFAPIVQDRYRLIMPFPLKGVAEDYKDVSFDKNSWWDGTYSRKKEDYISHNFGLRDYLIRLYNQLSFDLWKTSNTMDVVIGKENYLYEKGYIDAFFGVDFIGHDSIAISAYKLKMIQDTLAKLNKTLLIILAPGKGDFFPEYIPEKYFKRKMVTNFEVYKNELEKNSVNFIDFNSWFIKNKFKATYPLFPQCGIHWSLYGSWLAADSVIKKLEAIRNIDLADAKCVFLSYPEEARFNDYDVGEGLNLLFKVPSYKMAYPFITIEENTKKIRPNALVIGDSFYRLLLNTGIPDKVFNTHTYWYYNRVTEKQDKSLVGLTGKDLQSEINKEEVIISILNKTPSDL